MREVALLVQFELREAARSRWLPSLALGLALLVWVAASVQAAGPAFGSGFNRTTASLLNVVLVVVPAFAMLVGALRWAGEREKGAVAMLLAQPVSRSEVVLAVVLGNWAALALAIAFGLGLGGAMLTLFVPLGSIAEYLAFLAVAIALSGASVSLGVLFGAIGGSRLRALGLALVAWLLFTVVYDLFLLSLFAAVAASGRLFVAGAVGNPVEAARILAILAVEPDLQILGPVGGYLRDRLGLGTTTALLAGTMALWVAGPLGAAVAVFQRQDA